MPFSLRPSTALWASRLHRDQTGIVTVVGLLVTAMLALLGATAAMVTSTDILIGGQYKTSQAAFYAAEAGTEEARARLRLNAGAALIADAHPTSAQWRAYIGDITKAQAKGYDASQSQHLHANSLQSGLTYVVTIRHKTTADGQVLYWGDANGDGRPTANATTGHNIYVVTSAGAAATAARTVEVEMTRIPPITVPSPVYVEAFTTILGSSTTINGYDSCGSAHKPGIISTLAPGNVEPNGNPVITGVGGTPSIMYHGTDMDVQAMVNALKPYATHTYTVTGATHSGMNWGTPTPGATQQSASACGVTNVVHYKTQGTHISLTGGSAGCGILLVEGDLNIHGGFNWYGPVLVTGSVTMTGGGDKNLTGALIAGGSADADMIGGNASLVYCSQAITNQTQNRPLMSFSWREP